METMTGTFMISYDVECSDPAVTSDFLRHVVEVHEQAGVGATLFVLGRIAAYHEVELRRLATHPLFDLQQHTYSHPALQTVRLDDGRIVPGVPLAEALADIERGHETMLATCGVRGTGLSAPYVYTRGLAACPELLHALWRRGIRFLLSDGRDAAGRQPLPLAHQPYMYAEQDLPGMLECCVHGWVDCNLRPQLGWDRPQAYADAVRTWLEEAAAHDWVFSSAQHDWSSLRGDPAMQATASILAGVHALGMRTLRCCDYYAERLAATSDASTAVVQSGPDSRRGARP